MKPDSYCITSKSMENLSREDLVSALPSHPRGVRPTGNAYTAKANLRSAAGLFGHLGDELINEILEHLDGQGLHRLGQTCKALYAFSGLEDLWKTLCIERPSNEPLVWQGSWRRSFLKLAPEQEARISCVNLFSDLLYRPYHCAHLSLAPFVTSIPTANRIARLANLTCVDFTRWVDRPFILEDPAKDWPVYRTWSIPFLLEKYGSVCFRAEAVDWPFKSYVEYMNDNADESPLYLFDARFVEKMGLRVGTGSDVHADYWPPACFGEDLFGTLGDDRPDSRWLIIGNERSGSTFHKDPNATSAWNAVILGSKYWIMFPSSDTLPPPPGVFVSEDQSEVTSPLSIAEWLLGFHAEARKSKGCLEGICNAGEVLYVPSGWWHLVVNLGPSIAITQNFVPQAHLAAALLFLRDQSYSVSGFGGNVANPYSLFLQRLEEQQPAVLTEALLHISKLEDKRRKRKWDEIAHTADDGGSNGAVSGFTFGFGGDDENDESGEHDENDGDKGNDGGKEGEGE